MRHKRQWLTLLGGSTLAILAILVLWFWKAARQAIVMPIYTLFRNTSLTLAGIPQHIYLFLLVALGIWVATRALFKLNRKPETLEDLVAIQLAPHVPRFRFHSTPVVQDLGSDPLHREPSRYHTWLRQSLRLEHGDYFRNSFAADLRMFALTILAFQEGLNTDEVEERVNSGKLEVPAEVGELIATRTLKTSPSKPMTLLQRWFLRWIKPSIQNPHPVKNPMDQQIEAVLTFLEQRLETKRDRHPG